LRNILCHLQAQPSRCSPGYLVGIAFPDTREALGEASKANATNATVSQELVSEFNALLANEKHFGLLATITSETLQPYKTLTPSTGAFAIDLSTLLAPELAPKQPLYILLRRFPTAPRFVAISYIPDAAAVRQKMLFAATRLTLVRELGTEHFRETVFATTPEELTARGFERHDAHARLEAPLTEEERSLGEVKKAEMEAGQGTGQKEIHMSGRFAMPIGAGCVDALKELDGGSNSLVMLVSAELGF
jgi:twinfilin-like protein